MGLFKKGDSVFADFSSKRFPNDIRKTKILGLSGDKATVDTRNICSGAKRATMDIKFLRKVGK